MDFEFSGEQRLLKESAREVMEKEIIPIADEYDKGKLLHDRKRLKELLDKLAPLGYLGRGRRIRSRSRELGDFI